MESKQDKHPQINILLGLATSWQPVVEDFNIIGRTAAGHEAHVLAGKLKASVVIVSTVLDDMAGSEACYKLTEDFLVSVIIIDTKYSIEKLHDAVRARARFYFSQPIDTKQFHTEIREAYKYYEYRRKENLY